MIAYAAFIIALVLIFVPARAGAEPVTSKLSSSSSDHTPAHVSLMKPFADAINGGPRGLVTGDRRLDGKLSPGEGRWVCFE